MGGFWVAYDSFSAGSGGESSGGAAEEGEEDGVGAVAVRPELGVAAPGGGAAQAGDVTGDPGGDLAGDPGGDLIGDLARDLMGNLAGG